MHDLWTFVRFLGQCPTVVCALARVCSTLRPGRAGQQAVVVAALGLVPVLQAAAELRVELPEGEGEVAVVERVRVQDAGRSPGRRNYDRVI